MILVPLQEHYSIHKYHAISHRLKQKMDVPQARLPVDACFNLFKSNVLGQLFIVNPRHTERFCRRLLLVKVTTPLSFQEIRKVN